MQGLNEVISTQLIFDDKNEKTLGTYLSNPSWRKFDILQALSSLNKTPRRSCFESEISFKKFLFLPRPKIFFWGKTLGTIFSFNIRNDAKIFFVADQARKSPRRYCFSFWRNLLLSFISILLRNLRFTRWNRFSV